ALPQPHLHRIAAAARRDGPGHHRGRAVERTRGQGVAERPARHLERIHLLAGRTVLVIDFRYHLVSTVAIFLALTVGIVLGSTVLQEPLIKSAEETTAQLRQSNEDFRRENTGLRQREAGFDAFVAAVTPRLLSGMLAGERVVVIEAPGADSGLR